MDISSIDSSTLIEHIQLITASRCTKGTDKGQDVVVEQDTPEGEVLARQVERILQDLKLDNVMKIDYNEELDRIIVQMLDGDTNAVKRQIPSEDFIVFLRKFKQITIAAIEREV